MNVTVRRFTVPQGVFPKTAFRALPNKHDRGAQASRFELVNRGRMRGLKGLSSYMTVGADGQPLYLDAAGLTDDQTIHAIQAWLAPNQLAQFQAMVRAGIDQATAQKLLNNALTCTRAALWSNIDGSCVNPATGAVQSPNQPQEQLPGNYAAPIAGRPSITTQQISMLAPAQMPPPSAVGAPAGYGTDSGLTPAKTPSSTSGGGANASLTNPPGTSTGTSNQQQQQAAAASGVDWIPLLIAAGGLLFIMQMGK